MKKRLSIVLVVLLLAMTLVFTGCGKKQATPAAVAPAATVAPAPAPAAPAKVALDADAVLLAAAQEYFSALSTSNNMIAAKDLKALLEDNPDALVLVDIRSAADFEAGHIDGAYHSAWADLGAVMEKIPTNRQVVIVCCITVIVLCLLAMQVCMNVSRR